MLAKENSLSKRNKPLTEIRGATSVLHRQRTVTRCSCSGRSLQDFELYVRPHEDFDCRRLQR